MSKFGTESFWLPRLIKADLRIATQIQEGGTGVLVLNNV